MKRPNRADAGADAGAPPGAPQPPSRRRRVAAVAGSAVAGFVLLALLRPCEDRGDPGGPSAAPGALVAPGGPARVVEANRAAPPASGPVGLPGAPPVIDGIEVEKNEVCSGEENLVTIKAHTPDGTDAFLHYAVGGSGTGQRLPLRVYRNPDGTYDLPEVSVFGRNNVVSRAQVPAFRVNDCEPLRAVHVQSRALPNAPSEFEFFARIVDVGAKKAPDATPFKPKRYYWTFGDGSSDASVGPIVAHSYRSRPQHALFSQLLVAVEISGEGGDKLVGRSSIELLNTSFEDFEKKHIVSLTAVPEPRFPELSRDGFVRQSFRLLHQRPTPVRIDRVIAVKHFGGAEPVPPASAPVSGALGLSEIPPGEGSTVSLSLDTRGEPDVFSITYQLEGVTPEGYAVRGSFSLMRPPPPPTKDTNTPVDDPALVAKIQRAREILRQEFVTDEDIWRLEREGKLGAPAPAASAPE